MRSDRSPRSTIIGLAVAFLLATGASTGVLLYAACDKHCVNAPCWKWDSTSSHPCKRYLDGNGNALAQGLDGAWEDAMDLGYIRQDQKATIYFQRCKLCSPDCTGIVSKATGCFEDPMQECGETRPESHYLCKDP